MTDKPRDACLNCGARYDFPMGSFPLVIISDTAYDQLRALFLKQVDHYRCRACDEPLDLRATVVISIGEGLEYLYCLSDRLITAPDSIRKTFVDGIQSKGARVEAFATLDQLRVAYAKRIASMVERILQGIEAVSRDFDEFTTEGWRPLSSNHFAAGLIALSTPLPRVTVDFPWDAEEALERIAILQAGVWLSLCNSWSGDLEEGRTLERDLGHYMAPNAIFPRAADEFLRWTEPPEPLPLVTKFCLEAMRASLYLWCKKPNPRLREWADLFVEQEVERDILGEQSPPHRVAMEISAQRARDTIPYEELFDACLRQFCGKGCKLLPHLSELGQKVGYPDLAERLMSAIRPLPNGGQVVSVDQFVETLLFFCQDGSIRQLLMLASNCLDALEGARSPETLCHVTDRLKDFFRSDIDRVRIESWLCSNLLRNGLPKAVLERIGDQAQPWEKDLTLEVRVDLWTERSNALRMCGRGTEALAVAGAVIADLEAADEAISPQLRRNLGILYREAGRHEQALAIFLKLLPDADRDLDLLDSLVVTYVSLGRIAEAISYLERMSKLAQGPYADRHPAIIATLAGAKAAIGERREALALLREVPLDKTDDVKVLFPYASSWVTLSLYGEPLEEEDCQNLSRLVTKIQSVHETTLKNGNMRINVEINRLLAWLVDLTKVEHPNIYWEQVDVGARKFEGAPDPMAILALGRNAWAEGQQEKARDYLLEVPSAVAKRYGLERDISLKIQSLYMLRILFYNLVELADRAGSFEDLRLVAELKRDMLGRIAAASAGAKVPSAGFIVPDTQTIAQLGGPTAVFEWVDGPDGVYGLATFIAADGTVTESDQSPLEIDDDQLAERITQRLSTWFPGRRGTPLDLENWQSFENWLVRELEDRLLEGGQLVVIEHEEVAGLQWHVAAAPRWRVSYAPSWSALLNARLVAVPIREGPIGLAVVPKYRESADNLRALGTSVSSTAQLAAQLRLEVKSALREACDRDALVEVLEGTTVAKVLCHGFVDPDEDVVALMVAHAGELPLGNSVAANTPAGRRHRFDWRDCQHLKSAPAVLFSAACSSGQSHHAGLGEKLGLFSTLRRAGTRSVVAPRWDIEPAVVLPILDSAMERYLRTGAELGEALHAACSEASEVLPRWQAWALALEGDWK
jgi:tetratricopeptide (TPR) repeat protein